jgi:hypothetical protein
MKDLPPDLKELFEKYPSLPLIATLLAGVLCMQGPSPAPAWVKDVAPIGGRRNGAWRGKGSFGKSGFGGVKVRHK